MLIATVGATSLMEARPAEHHAAMPASCTAGEYRQFDFWLGDWDVYESDKPETPVARARIDGILDGCALREVYEQKDGLVGQSFSVYDASRKTWHQTWVTNRGQLLMIEGGLNQGHMVLEGEQRASDGSRTLVRGTWQPERDGVREIAVTSTDGGKNWKPWFDIVFRRHSS